MSKVSDRAAAESLKQLLSGTRRELDEVRLTSSHHKNEIDDLQSRIEELKVSLVHLLLDILVLI